MREVLVEHTRTPGKQITVHIFAAVSISDRDVVRGRALEHVLGKFPSAESLEKLKNFRESSASASTQEFTSIHVAEGAVAYKYVKQGGRSWEHFAGNENAATILFINGPNFIGKATLELAQPAKSDI